MVRPAAKRDAVAHLKAVIGLSQRRACRIISADWKTIRYRSCRPPEVERRTKLRDLANERGRFEYRRLFILLRREGEPSGVNRIYRLYREEGLSVRNRKGRRRAAGTRDPCAGAGRSEGQCPLVAGLRPRSVRLRQTLWRAQCRRRRDARVPYRDPRHIHLRASRRTRTYQAPRTTRQGWPGRGITRSSGTTSHRENQCRTAMSSPSTAACAASS